MYIFNYIYIYIYIYERETSVSMCYTITVKQKTQRLFDDFRILLILSHMMCLYIYIYLQFTSYQSRNYRRMADAWEF